MAGKRPSEPSGGTWLVVVLIAASLGIAALKLRTATTAGLPGTDASASPAAPTQEESLHSLTARTIDGQDQALADYRGKVLLVVNTASECGYTPQYAGLEKLHERFAARGFAVLGFPSNDFGAQEPGSDADIKAFCSSKFGVSFPMFSKIVVKGPSKHPVYALLTGAQGGEVRWNFTKFLVGKDGRVLERFEPDVAPDDARLAAAIEKALGG